jgi:hypothetical protein
MTTSHRALIVELDDATLGAQLERISSWLRTVETLQAGYRKLLGDTLPTIEDPLVRTWLTDLHRHARRHEADAAHLYATFGLSAQSPPLVPALAGAVLGLGRELVGQVQGRLSGASGEAWRNLRRLTLSNLDSMSAFAVVEQFGLALGRPRVVDVAFRVVSEKSEHQLLLREVFLEFAADAVLYRSDV